MHRTAGRGQSGGLSCYVHVPFCGRVCPYCDFAVVAGEDDLTDRYFEAVLSEIGMEPSARPLKAVFIGGGTPSRVSPAWLGSVIALLADRFGLVEEAEITLEANPEDWTLGLAEDLVAVGFNRVSFGVQSFDDDVLGDLGRRHTAEDGQAVLSLARAAGFRSTSFDLIFGSPSESVESWRRTVVTALDLEPDHVSTYALTVERGTELSRQVAAGAAGPDSDDQAEKYDLARRLLEAAGFDHYEVSNYTRPGHACAYNLNTWAQGDYLAFGLGAHGHRGGTRRRNVRRLDSYLDMAESGLRPEAGTEQVTGWDAELERVFLGVRRRGGIEAGKVGLLLRADPDGSRLIEAGKLEVADDRIRVVDPLFTDAVARVVLGLVPPPTSTGSLSTRIF